MLRIEKDMKEFRKTAKSLHRLYETECNRELTKREKNRYTILELKIDKLCKLNGLHFYLQTDPRGGTLYLADEPIPKNDYNRAGKFIA